MFETAVRGGTVVTADGVAISDIGIDGGRILELGTVGAARQEIDATGLLVIPGGIDPHTHLAAQQRPGGPRSPTDFAVGSRAAAFGGITTILDYAVQRPGGTLHEALGAWTTRAQGASVDYGFHIVLADASAATLAEIPILVELGHPTFKLFLHRFNDDDALAALIAIRNAGGMAMLHCQDGAVDAAALQELGSGDSVPASAWPLLRPPESENAGTERGMSLAAASGCPVYVVHVSTAISMDRIAGARRAGQRAFVEVRPIHLWFSEERYRNPDAWLTFSGYPPLRPVGDVDRLWQAIIDGEVDVVGSDHAAWTREQKAAAALDSRLLPVGLAGLETLRSAMFLAGVVERRITADRFVALTSGNAASILGLGSRKGGLGLGMDADLVLWDAGAVRVFDADFGQSGVDLDPFHGVRLVGGPTRVLARGTTILQRGAYTGVPGRGQLLRRHLH